MGLYLQWCRVMFNIGYMNTAQLQLTFSIYKTVLQNAVLNHPNTEENYELGMEACNYINGVTLPEKNEKLSKSISIMWLVTGLFWYCLKKPEIYLSRRSNESEDVQ